MFDDLYQPLPDFQRYLNRIGFADDISSNYETLDALVNAHLRSVPFENLDIFDYHREISLGIPDLFNKIVINKRGGYCFELNGLFMSLLQALGFQCHAIAARVLWNKDYFPPLSHRATIITLENRLCFCDVGFGGPCPGLIYLNEPGIQIINGLPYLFERGEHTTTLFTYINDKKVPLLMFSELPCDPVDFITLNEYFSKNSNSYFRSKRIVNLRTEDGSKSIDGNIFTDRRGEYCEKSILNTDDNIANALDKHFGIYIDIRL